MLSFITLTSGSFVIATDDECWSSETCIANLYSCFYLKIMSCLLLLRNLQYSFQHVWFFNTQGKQLIQKPTGLPTLCMTACSLSCAAVTLSWLHSGQVLKIQLRTLYCSFSKITILETNTNLIPYYCKAFITLGGAEAIKVSYHAKCLSFHWCHWQVPFPCIRR